METYLFSVRNPEVSSTLAVSATFHGVPLQFVSRWNRTWLASFHKAETPQIKRLWYDFVLFSAYLIPRRDIFCSDISTKRNALLFVPKYAQYSCVIKVCNLLCYSFRFLPLKALILERFALFYFLVKTCAVCLRDGIAFAPYE